jgi:peptide/nickel transport system substrate-binding protein
MKKIFFIALLLVGWGVAETPKDTLVFACCADSIDTLDPEGSYDTVSGFVLENIYETLYTYKGESLDEFTPLLATDYTVSDDGLTYTFTLRQGVKFHSGNEFTCQDAEYSFQRTLVMNDSQSGVWFLAESYLGNDGSNAAADDESITWEQIDNAIECIDDYTVALHITKPEAAFFVKLLYTNSAIIDSKWAIENSEWSGTESDWRDWINRDPREGYLHDHASGTGAYKLVSWDDQNLIAESFADYWGEKPSISKVLVQSIEEEASAILALQNRDVDRAGVSRQTLESQVRDMPGVKVWEDPTWIDNSAFGFFMNQNISSEANEDNLQCGELGCGIPADFFADENVRLGFAHTFDTQQFIDEVLLGHAQPLTMLLPPFFPGYDDTIPVYDYNPELAEEYFRKAFGGEVWEKGFNLVITHDPNSTYETGAVQILKAGLEDLNPNFRVTLTPIDFPTFLEQSNNGRLGFYMGAWAPDYADPDNFIYTFYHSSGAYGSQVSLKDTELDGLIEQAREITDFAERETLYNKIGQLANERGYYIPLTSDELYRVSLDNVNLPYLNLMLSTGTFWKDYSKQ